MIGKCKMKNVKCKVQIGVKKARGERRDLFGDAIAEARGDLALGEAIREGLKTQLVRRHTVMAALNAKR